MKKSFFVVVGEEREYLHLKHNLPESIKTEFEPIRIFREEQMLAQRDHKIFCYGKWQRNEWAFRRQNLMELRRCPYVIIPESSLYDEEWWLVALGLKEEPDENEPAPVKAAFATPIHELLDDKNVPDAWI